MTKKLRVWVLPMVILSLTACSATNTALTKHSLTVQSKMSDSIFLDPVSEKDKTVYVDVKNTSDYQDFNIKQVLVSDLQNKGYKVMSATDDSHYLLQLNIKQVGKTSPKDANSILHAGYGGALSGAVMGVTAASVAHSEHLTAAGLLGGATGYLANSLVKDVAYMVITDVQLSERAKQGEVVKQEQKGSLKQGSSTVVNESTSTTSDWHRYRTRVVSTADKMNLSFKKAEPALERNLASSIAGLL